MLEARNFRLRKKSDCTRVGYRLVVSKNIKADLSCALICTFDILYAKCKFLLFSYFHMMQPKYMNLIKIIFVTDP